MLQHWGIIMLALVEGAREKRGNEWCRKWGIGWARRRIGVPARNVIGITPDPTFDERVKASETLKRVCFECGQCRMAKE